MLHRIPGRFARIPPPPRPVQPFRRSRTFGGAATLALTAADIGYMVFVDTYSSGVSSQGLIAVTLPSTLTSADEGATIGVIKYPVTSGSINGHSGQVSVTNGDFTHYLNTPYKTAIYQWSGTVWRLIAPALQEVRGNHVTVHRTVSSTPFDIDFTRDQGSVLRAVTGAGGVGGNMQLNLPLISTTVVPGASYLTSDAWIQKSGIDNYKATFVPQNGESIQGVAFVSFYNGGQGVISLTHDLDTLHLESDGNEYKIIGGRLATDGLVKNALNNSAFKLWNGVTTATARADGVEFAPFWNVLTQTAAVNLTRLDNPWEGARYAARLTQNQASSQRMGVVQWIKGADSAHRRGATHIFGAKMRSNVAGTIVRYALLSWTGTEDSPTVDVVNDWTNGTYTAGQFFLGSNLTISQHGFMNLITADQVYDLVPLQGQFSTSLNNVMLLVWTESVAAQNTTVDISLGMLTPGGVPRLHRDVALAEEQLRVPAELTSIGNAMVGDSGSGGTKGLVPAPSAGDAAAGKFLKADGTFVAAPIVLAESGVAVAHTGTTAHTAIVTIAIPAGAPGANGRVEVFVNFSNNNSGNNKTPRVLWGASGAGVAGTVLWATTNTTNVGNPVMAGVHNRNSASSQIAIASPAGNSMGATAAAFPTAAVNTAAAAEIVLSGELANSGDTITVESYRVLLFPKA